MLPAETSFPPLTVARHDDDEDLETSYDEFEEDEEFDEDEDYDEDEDDYEEYEEEFDDADEARPVRRHGDWE
ncbi:MAG: hypothetical protein JSW43_04140 [Gemmatimonadota bacterium]|nr:MAG: hypothetical protein JSW43_04140 [Gemmatimonadota bacterium]